MAKLLITSPFGLQSKKHTHLVDVQAGVVSISNGHAHGIVSTPDGIVSLTPGDTGHTHNIANEYDPPRERESVSKGKDELVAAIDTFKQLKSHEKDVREKANLAQKMRDGDQWPDQAKQALDKDGRAHLTFNFISGMIDSLSGIQRQQRTAFKVLPTENGSVVMADMITHLLEHASEKTDLAIVESSVFDDKITVGRGVYHYYVDREKNLEGDIVIKRLQWDSVYLGPHQEYDLSDMEVCCLTSWISRSKAEAMFPSLKDIEESCETSENDENDANKLQIKGKEYEVQQYGQSYKPVDYGTDPDLVNAVSKKVRIAEIWQKEFYSVRYLIDLNTNEITDTRYWEPEMVKQALTMPHLSAFSKRLHKMKVTTLVGGKIAKNEYPDLIVDDFPIIVDYCNYCDNKWYGKIRDVIDPQRDLNKRQSQLVDFTSKMVSGFWMTEPETFNSPRQKKNFAATVSGNGSVVEVASLAPGKAPQRVDPPAMPAGLVDMVQRGSDMIKDISLVSPELLGQSDTNTTSGVMFVHKRSAALTGNERLFDLSSFAKKQLGRVMVKLMVKIYSPERMYRILNNVNQKSKNAYDPESKGLQIVGKPFEEFTREDIMQLIGDVDVLNYDIIVSESPQNGTTRRAAFLELAELAKSGLPIPATLLIEYSDIKDRDKILAQLQQQERGQQEIEKMKQQADMMKTLSSAGAPAGLPLPQ